LQASPYPKPLNPIDSLDASSLLDIQDLCVEFGASPRSNSNAALLALDRVSLALRPGETLGLVGESGAGKSLTGAAVLGLLPSAARISCGRIFFRGQRIDNASERELRRLRGRQIGAVFQDPLTALNPLYTVGQQLVQTIQTHLPLNHAQALERAVSLLAETGLNQPEQRLRQYPHQFSGGMRQRVVIALALAADPVLLVADEPTTALDVSTQAQIMALLKRLCRKRGVAILLITHDMGVIAQNADRVAVMYGGRVLESGLTATLLHQPQHPYTAGLMGSIPSCHIDTERLTQMDGEMPPMPRVDQAVTHCAFAPRCPQVLERCRREQPVLRESSPVGRSHQVACWWVDEGGGGAIERSAALPQQAMADVDAPSSLPSGTASSPLLRVRNLSKTYALPHVWGAKRAVVHAVDGVNLEIERGQTVGLVGESGCGKTTLARMLVGLETPTQGQIEFDGVPLQNHLKSGGARRWQMIFQNPYASLNPRWRVLDLIAEPLLEQGLARSLQDCRERVAQVLTQVGLCAQDLNRYAHQFSGGQRQRLSIARALIANPEGVVCDEPTSALDVSVQAQVLNLMKDLQRKRGLTLLLISHNLAVVRQLSHRIGVMYAGRLVEWSSKANLFAQPRHPYTQMLLASVPDRGQDDLHKSMTNREERRHDEAFAQVPTADAALAAARGGAGCAFYGRCPKAQLRCQHEQPQLRPIESEGNWVACHAVP
jgi:oligopeptide/dipeptide ABC transporter ATP-binding protein